MVQRHHEKVAFIWSIAELLRGDYKRHEYQDVILPLVVLRRLDCVLEPTKEQVLQRAKELEGKVENVAPVLMEVAKQQFYNTSPLTFEQLLDDPENVAGHLRLYIQGFSENAREVIDKFRFEEEVDRLEQAGLLYQVMARFAEIDLHPDVVSNLEMGYIFEELVRRFAEQSNETAGEHFTPREVIRLMVNLLFIEDVDVLTKSRVIKTLFDPACGTGGMLSVAEEYLRELNPGARLVVFGQELNAETYAICKSDMMIKGHDPSNIAHGNSFSEDGFGGHRFDYMLTNPPFGVDWKKVRKVVEDEHKREGFDGRFGAGTPRISDGQLLFLQHMLSKIKPYDPDDPEKAGSRLAIVFNGSPLFSGGAGSGESEIRKWIIENDWLEAIVGLPEELFYNTGIATYVWVLTNRKSEDRRGKVQLIDARDMYVKMRRSLGNKRNEISQEQIDEITRIYGDFLEAERSKVLPNEAFGYQRITVERPLRVAYRGGPEAVEALKEERAFQRLAKAKKFTEAEAQEIQETVIRALEQLPEEPERDRDVLAEKLEAAVGEWWEELRKPERQGVWSAVMIKDPDAPPLVDEDRNPEPDSDLRDYENVPLIEDIHEYFEREVKPHVPDAWIDESRTQVGYEIPFTRLFYKYEPPRPLEEIDADIKKVEQEILELLGEVTS